MWNGTAPTLNSRPMTTIAAPMSSSASLPMVLASAGSTFGTLPSTTCAMRAYDTEPAYPYSRAMPNRVNAEAKAPSRKYLTAASCDMSRLRRASAHRRYSGREKTSRATNRVSRSLAEGNTSMPATAKSRSGKTSVVVKPALTAAFSLSPPGTAAACAAKESTRLPCAAGSSRRSAKVNRATRLASRIVPWRKSEGPSTAMAPMAAMCALVVPYPSVASATTAANAAASATTDTNTCA